MKLIKLYFLAIFNCLIIIYANGQTLPLINYTIQNGLPEATVYAVYVDGSGYLWVGTQGGVAAFNGRQFHIYDSQLGIPDNHVTAITGTEDGYKYFGHRSGALSIWKNKVITVFHHPDYQNNKVINSIIWQNHALYIATEGNGLFCIFVSRGKCLVKHLTQKEQLPSNFVKQLTIKNNNELWLATTGGLCVFNTQTKTVAAVTLPATLHQSITTVCQQKNGWVWCGTQSGAISFNPDNLAAPLKRISISNGLIDGHINKILEDQRGNIWLATNKGVAKIAGGIITCFTKKNGLLSEIVNDITLDREHNIWFGQEDGISCYKNLPLELYTVQDGLIYGEVYSIIQDSRHRYWIGTAQGITVYEGEISATTKHRNYTVKDGLPDNLIYKVFEDSHRHIWIACVNNGAACFLPEKNKFIVFNHTNGLSGKRVVSINEDSKGRIWLATLDSGIAVYNYNHKQMQSYTKGHGFMSNSVWTIHKDANGKLWFGSQDTGLIYQDPATDSFVVVTGQQQLPNHNFGSISSDSKGNIWIASIGAGIFKYNGKKFNQYGIRQGIKSNNPYFIFCDKQDNIWLGTNLGISLFNSRSLTTRNFTKNDGFIGIETNQNAIYQDKNNTLWIGTINGLMRFQYQGYPDDPPAPLIYITKKHLLFDEKDLRTNKLTYQQNDITFDYLGVSLSNAEKIHYSYFLNGYDHKWSPLLTESRVSYANLPPGKYSFMVKAGFAEGKWSSPATYPFVISPPFYKTWWFLLLAGAFIYIIASVIYHYRVNQLLKLVKIRNKIASDLHDDIGSALSSISIFSEVADKQLEQGVDPKNTREIIAHISNQSSAMLEAMDDIVWAVNPKNDYFRDLAVRMREFAIPLLEAHNIQFQMDIVPDIQHIKIQMEGRKSIFMIFKESINNVLKHACCTKLWVSVKKINNQLEFIVRDNGKGYDPNHHTNRNGLANMQKRAQEMDATLQIITQPGDGTQIRLLVNII